MVRLVINSQTDEDRGRFERGPFFIPCNICNRHVGRFYPQHSSVIINLQKAVGPGSRGVREGYWRGGEGRGRA
jgi:hypothetical protein